MSELSASHSMERRNLGGVVMWAILRRHVKDVHDMLAQESELRKNGSQSWLP